VVPNLQQGGGPAQLGVERAGPGRSVGTSASGSARVCCRSSVSRLEPAASSRTPERLRHLDRRELGAEPVSGDSPGNPKSAARVGLSAAQARGWPQAQVERGRPRVARNYFLLRAASSCDCRSRTSRCRIRQANLDPGAGAAGTRGAAPNWTRPAARASRRSENTRAGDPGPRGRHRAVRATGLAVLDRPASDRGLAALWEQTQPFAGHQAGRRDRPPRPRC